MEESNLARKNLTGTNPAGANLAARANREVHRLRRLLEDRDRELEQTRWEVTRLGCEVSRLQQDASHLAECLSHTARRYADELTWRLRLEKELTDESKRRQEAITGGTPGQQEAGHDEAFPGPAQDHGDGKGEGRGEGTGTRTTLPPAPPFPLPPLPVPPVVDR